MGATGWTYFAPYQDDAERALQELRQDVFARRAYALPGDLLAGMSDQAIAAAMPPLPNLRKLLNLSKALDQAMEGLGADIESAAKDTQDMERFLQAAESEGIAKATRKATGGKRKKAPKSIDHARDIAREAGTHSILDIDATATTRGFGHATPLSRDELLALFGTEKPTRDAVREKEKQGELIGLRDPWEAAYFTVYEGDKPSDFVFCGCSGD
jgi:hypothetical protein